MVDKPNPAEMELVPCAVCQKEIPKSVALTSEDVDYVLHFCGLDCYEEWSADQAAVKARINTNATTDLTDRFMAICLLINRVL